jgi:hypothetical protein
MAPLQPATKGRALAASMALAALGAAACLGGVNRVYDDGGADEAVPDVASPDTTTGGADGGGEAGADAAAGDATVLEGGPAEAGVTPDAPSEAEAGPVFLCNGQPVTSCAGCAGGNTVGCIFCAPDGSHPGVCGPKQYCQNVAPPGAAVCNCPGSNTSSCPAPFQVCTTIGPTDYCQTCGEPGSGTHLCKGGGTCDEASGQCK